ncbi:MAG: CDGSH iron-sulfur domain-containing protein [Candidatus Dadabacteria bacterium]|nr:CDGSH iron-sulfur domain-containing protein [Candidatus Dadabacteria bacterium]
MSEKCCINVFDDGPLGVERFETLTNSNGDELEVNRGMALCRCGTSQNKPYCDGSHKKTNFSDE